MRHLSEASLLHLLGQYLAQILQLNKINIGISGDVSAYWYNTQILSSSPYPGYPSVDNSMHGP